MDLMEIVRRSRIPQPWSEGEKIPWNEPGFSRRMLRVHLSQEHDWASRRATIIQKHVDWIHREFLCNSPARILDLGCGPGLYTSLLAGLGHDCTGVDFSPASIEYAIKNAQKAHLHCSYQLADIRKADLGSGYDLVIFIFGEFNVFTPADAMQILQKSQAALQPGGLFCWKSILLRKSISWVCSLLPGIPQTPVFFLTGHISVCRRISGMMTILFQPSGISL
jgi:2-polyprenyl-3-methyl-5-hydroxy-6-metoxy-1,4-benzoquinol methylase